MDAQQLQQQTIDPQFLSDALDSMGRQVAEKTAQLARAEALLAKAQRETIAIQSQVDELSKKINELQPKAAEKTDNVVDLKA